MPIKRGGNQFSTSGQNGNDPRSNENAAAERRGDPVSTAGTTVVNVAATGGAAGHDMATTTVHVIADTTTAAATIKPAASPSSVPCYYVIENKAEQTTANAQNLVIDFSDVGQMKPGTQTLAQDTLTATTETKFQLTAVDGSSATNGLMGKVGDKLVFKCTKDNALGVNVVELLVSQCVGVTATNTSASLA